MSIGIVWLILNILTVLQYPVPWIDEVMFTDPAARWALGHGFNSTAWPTLSPDAPFAGYPPLYSWLMALGFRVLGVSQVVSRASSMLWGLLCMPVLWSLCGRLGIRSWGARSACLIVVFCGYGVSMSYRSGRPDSFMMMLALIAAWWALDARPVARRFALFLTGTAIGLTSLALLVYIGLATVFMLAWKRGSGLDRAVALGAGLALSVGLMWAGFRASGTWESFVWSTQVQSGKGLLACLASHTPYDHRNRLPKDLSLVPIVIAAVWMRLSDAGRRHEQRYELDSALGFAAFVGAGMILVGKLPTYYSWMVYVPLVIGLATTWPEAFGRGARDILAASLVVVAVLVGLPLQAGLTLLDLGNRDPRAAEAFAIRTCEPGDRAFTDYPAYFVVRSRVQEVYTPGALGWKDERWRRGVELVVASRGTAGGFLAAMGGTWVPVDSLVARARSPLERIFKRPIGLGNLEKHYDLFAFRRVH